MNHSDFQKKVSELLKNKGCWLFNIHGHRMQKRGVPDLLVIGLRWKGFLEFKIGRDKCSRVQQNEMEKIERRGMPCYVLRYDEENDAIQIENKGGDELNFVVWDALWDWLKKHIGDPNYHWELP